MMDKELLEIALEHIETAFKLPGWDYCDGLCALPETLNKIKVLSFTNLIKLEKYFDENIPDRHFGDYCWMPGEIASRKKWLEDQISKL